MLNATATTSTTTTSTIANERGFIRAAYEPPAEWHMNAPFSIRSGSNAL
jgi:hypothetical protein